ncbi:adenine-specific DNA-methyltransferase [Candidatus Magnetomoraceae bacterium gMMP-15]
MLTEAQKETGSYYTPKILSDFIVNYALLQNIKERNISILEPSVGDGIFIESFIENNEIKKFNNISITLIDINKDELSKAKKKVQSDCFDKTYITNEDFLKFQKKTKKRYSLIIGNPPYIKGSLLSEKQIELCKNIHQKAGLAKQKINNIWTAFVIGSIKILKNNGMLSLILPADLLQVKYAEEIRNFLEKEFHSIEIFTLDKSIFPDINQQTIILFAFKKVKTKKGTFFYSITDITQNEYKLISSNGLMINQSKWTHYNLTSKEIKLLNKINGKLPRISDFVDSSPGIVTGANNYFILSESTVKEYSLEKLVVPIIQKGSFVNGSIDFSKRDFKELVKQSKPAYLLSLNGKEKKHIKLEQYLKNGINLRINKRYKCSRRKNWYAVPNSSTPPDGFFFKRSHLYPKIVKNKANIYVTDAAYKIQMKTDYNIESLIFSFYNIITLIFAELTGRKYGGGVLELTPNEFKNLPIPYVNINLKNYRHFKQCFEKKAIEDVLLYNYNIFLDNYTIFSQNHILTLCNIYNKLITSRISS